MKILHISMGNYGGVPGIYFNLLNENTNLNCRLITLNIMHQDFPEDINLSKKYDSDEVENLIKTADVFHIHQPFYGKYDTLEISVHNNINIHFNNWGKFGKLFLSRLKEDNFVFTYHGVHLRSNPKSILDLDMGWKSSVTTPDLLANLPDSIWIPHYITDDCLHKPIIKNNDIIKFCHSSSMRIYHSTDFIIEIFEKLKKLNLPIELVLLENMIHNDVLKEKQKCHFNIGRVSIPGLYNTSDLESMIMGVISLSNIGNIRNVVGNIPIINVNKQNIEDTIIYLVENKNNLDNLIKLSRNWVLTNHNKYKTINAISKLYKRVGWL